MMWNDRDHYEAYYAAKLWNLLPAVYRAEDSAVLDRNGPLRELVNRLGGQAAILRRSLDRLWADQSIETCDDWVVAYIGDLLATNLVTSLDSRGQRLDVAKTIYYRRRKGTLAILEEIAADITGWDARVVEFFQHMGRTRHNFDPAIGLPAETNDLAGNQRLQQAQGLVGAFTQTPAGGWADLRNAYGASKALSAFDEFCYTGDVRRGRGQIGWHNIPRLGVFLWRLKSFGLNYTTPVEINGCPNHYTFDPTGRTFDPIDPLVGLFTKSTRVFGDRWVSPDEWQLPNPISPILLETDLKSDQQNLYAENNPNDSTKPITNSLGVYYQSGDVYEVLQAAITPNQPSANDRVTVYPKYGRFKILAPDPGKKPYVTYHYGFSSTVGAGPFDRHLIKAPTSSLPAPMQEISGGDETTALTNSLATLAPEGTITIKDSLTYTTVNDVGSSANAIRAVIIQSENKARPLLRPHPTAPNPIPWIFHGAPGSQLTLVGLFLSGIDIVLRGEFESVTLNFCTLDPGHFDLKTNTYFEAVDGKKLSPCHLQIEGQVKQLTINHCITGPITTLVPGIATQGNVTQLNINDSIIQAFGAEQTLNFANAEVHLNRCTLLGAAKVHRLEASECIFNDVIQVENPQQGCVRFSAWTTESVLPSPYESVEIPPNYPLFTSRVFGHPGYAQLQLSADAAIIRHTGGGVPTILEGAADGSEMGVFATEKHSIKERSLRIKYEEYMPLGLAPVMIYVT